MALIPKGSLLCMHSLTNGKVIPFTQSQKDRDLAWPVIKSVGNAGVCLDVKRIEPRTITILRFVNTSEDSAQDVQTWTEDQMRQHADAALSFPLSRTNADERKAIDLFEPINEADPPGVAGWAAFGKYLGIMANMATARGMRIAVPGTNRGTPEWPELQALVGSGCFARLKAGGHIWTAHEGGQGPGSDTPISYGFGDRIPGAPIVAGAGSLCFRYRYLYHLLASRNEIVPLFISEFYLGRQGADPVELTQRLAWYDQEMSKDPFVLGFAPYTIDPVGGWAGEDVTYAYPTFMDYNISQRARANGGGVVTPPVPVPTPVPTPTPVPVSGLWPRGVCLTGLHGRADGRAQPPDLTVMATSQVESAFLLTSAAPEEASGLLASGRFVMVRLFASFVGRQVSAVDFAAWMTGDMAPFYTAGVRHFQIHNEPNLRDEGWGLSWADGAAFADWFLTVRTILKARYPEALFGWPGLSPGATTDDGQRTDATVFLNQAAAATSAADFIAIHCYWLDESDMAAPLGGAGYLDYRRRFPGKLLFITEFANVNGATSYTDKGRQYVAYYKTLRHVANLGAAFAFVASASNPIFAQSAWRREDGSLTEIPGIVGSNMAAIKSTPVPPGGNPMSDAERATVRSVADDLRAQAARLDAVAGPVPAPVTKHTLRNLTNQQVINLFARAFPLPANYYNILASALDEAQMLANKAALYTQVAVEDMPGLTAAGKADLIAAL